MSAPGAIPAYQVEGFLQWVDSELARSEGDAWDRGFKAGIRAARKYITSASGTGELVVDGPVATGKGRPMVADLRQRVTTAGPVEDDAWDPKVKR